MKKASFIIILFGVLVAAAIILSSFRTVDEKAGNPLSENEVVTDQLKKSALQILTTKCNVCHRKKNPFMVFNEKNMSKRAPKIYKAVFIDRKMPKGDEIKLTHEEYTKLEKWLFTQQIF